MKGQDSITEILGALYEEWAGESPARILALPGAGSDRRYYRIYPSDTSRPTVIGCSGPDVTENVCFAQLSDVFLSHGARVPEVYAMSENRRAYLQQDLGDKSLFSLLDGMKEEEKERRVEEVWRNLIRIQQTDEELWEDAVMHPHFSRRQILWDLNYFKYEYLRVSGIPFDEDALENDFERFSEQILQGIGAEFWGFMYRDCQSRNVMMHDDSPYLIDFQGGRFGPSLYDAVAFLCQARAPFTESFRIRMARRYAEMYAEGMISGDSRKGQPVDELRHAAAEKMLMAWPILRVFRCLQVLGAYGLRGLVERRAHFVRSIPAALRQLAGLIDRGYLQEWPALQDVCLRLVRDARFMTPSPASLTSTYKDGKARTAVAGEAKPQLTVYVFSFSYMKGYPVDYSGNGGGFMFDCRAMHNPGRYAEYKTLTGRDRPVIEFLEERGEVQEFLKAAWMLVDPAVARYEQRGFESLQVGFGCTGGQHRSVYCAERTAAHLREAFPGVRVILEHRELGLRF